MHCSSLASVLKTRADSHKVIRSHPSEKWNNKEKEKF